MNHLASLTLLTFLFLVGGVQREHNNREFRPESDSQIVALEHKYWEA